MKPAAAAPEARWLRKRNSIPMTRSTPSCYETFSAPCRQLERRAIVGGRFLRVNARSLCPSLKVGVATQAARAADLNLLRAPRSDLGYRFQQNNQGHFVVCVPSFKESAARKSLWPGKSPAKSESAGGPAGRGSR